MTITRTVSFFKTEDCSGLGKGYSLKDSEKYYGIRGDELINSGIFQNIRSVKFWDWSSEPDPISVILFDNINLSKDYNFLGKYLMLSSSGTKDYSFKLNLDVLKELDRTTSSIAFIKRYENERLFDIDFIFKDIIKVDELFESALRNAEKSNLINKFDVGEFSIVPVFFPYKNVYGASEEPFNLSQKQSYLAINQEFSIKAGTSLTRYTGSFSIYLYFFLFEGVLMARVESFVVNLNSGSFKNVAKSFFEAELGKACLQMNNTLLRIGNEQLFNVQKEDGTMRKWKHLSLFPGRVSKNVGEIIKGDGFDMVSGNTDDGVKLAMA